jgi:hypothetical protein
MKRMTVVLMVALLAMPAMAGSVNLMFGDDFAGVDVSQRFGVVSLGVVGAVDYWHDSQGGNLAVVTQNNFVGPVVKLHALKEDSPVDLFAAYTALVQNGRWESHLPQLWEGGAMWNITKSIGVGLSYVYCEDAKSNSGVMFRLKPIQW